MPTMSASGRLDRKECSHTYTRLADEIFLTAEAIGSPPKKFSNFKYASYLAHVECFIEDVVRDDAIPFVRRYTGTDRISHDRNRLTDAYFKLIPIFIETVGFLSPKYEYNEHITLFADCCGAMGLRHDMYYWGICEQVPALGNPHIDLLTGAEIYNALVARIRQEWKARDVKLKIYNRRKESRERYAEYCKYADSLFEKYARLLVIRLDVFYQKQLAAAPDVHAVVADLNRLLNNRRSNTLFYAMCGYIAKIEYGIEKGIHIHLIYFFDGSKRNNSSHVHLAQEIGEYWVSTITKGCGAYWNCNAEASAYESRGRRGIGIVNHYDEKARANLSYVIRYLCKTDQYLRPKIGAKVRLIRRGDFHPIPAVKRGRRRQGRTEPSGESAQQR